MHVQRQQDLVVRVGSMQARADATLQPVDRRLLPAMLQVVHTEHHLVVLQLL
jgi:hypothetical protein